MSVGLELTSFKSVQKLSEICLKKSSPLSVDDRNNLKTIFEMLSSCDSSQEVYSWFKLQDRLLPLECLRQLQSYNFIQFTSYLYYNPHLIPELSDSFEELIWCQDDMIQQDCAETVADLLAVLVNLGVHSLREIYRPGHQLLTLVVNKFVDRLLGDSASHEEPVPFLSHLMSSSTCVQSRLQVFCISLLREMVQSTPEAVTLEEAVQNQAKLYVSTKTSPIIKDVFRQIFLKLSIDIMMKELNILVTNSEKPFNWQWLLTGVAVLSLESSRTELLKETIDKWVTQACASNNAELLSVALLCARQCCSEMPNKFGTYSSWFGNLQVRPADAFMFLFDFLSQLVPFEPVLCLKIHVNKVPSAPANCHRVIADYAVLAKTRLADLNQTTDYVGLFGEYTTTEQEGLEADILKVINHFKQTKEVMKVVLEASVFRRQFYEKVFLKELLKEYNPEHVEFIEKLHNIGKIPHGLYARWLQFKV